MTILEEFKSGQFNVYAQWYLLIPYLEMIQRSGLITTILLWIFGVLLFFAFTPVVAIVEMYT